MATTNPGNIVGDGLLDRASMTRLVIYLVLAVLAAGAFVGTLNYPFVYDDRYIVQQNPAIALPGDWLTVLTASYWPPECSLDPLYRPLTTLTFKLNYALGGDCALGFRAVNLALHALATVLVALLARRLWERDSAAWVAGVLFAVHPIHAEALGLVVGRAELLVGVFVSWMLLRHLRRDVSRTAPSARYHITMSLLFLLALGSKEHAVIAWPAVALIDLWQRRCSPDGVSWRCYLRRVLASHHLGLIFALALFFLMRWVVFGARTTLPEDLVNRFANPLLGAPLTVKAATPFALLWLMVRQWFAAIPLCPIWSVGGFALPTTFLRCDVLAGACLGIVMAFTVVLGWRKRWRLGLAVGIFALSVLLPCHFIPAANWLYAERWLYLPSVFMALLCGGFAARAPRFSVAGSTVAAVLLLAAALPYQRCWETHEGLFEAVVERQPYSYHGLVGLAAVRHRANRLSESRTHVERLTGRFSESERAWYFKILLARELEDWRAVSEALRRWGALRPPAPPPAEIARIAEEVRARGR